MNDPREKSLHQIDVEGSRIKFSEEPIVLLCGGGLKNPKAPDTEPPPGEHYSLRHFLQRYFLENGSSNYEVFRPEEVSDWKSGGHYSNLMDFEVDLSGVCSLVVVIVESAGSIAELGAFSQLPELSEKLMVVTSRDLDKETSFINLGILEFLREKESCLVSCYPWDICASGQVRVEKIVAQDFDEDVHDHLKSLTKSSSFDREHSSCVMAAIFELVSAFVALKESEILKYLQLMGINIGLTRLRNRLFLLVRFKIIAKEKYSDAFFYMAVTDIFHKLSFESKGSVKFDRTRLAMECSQFYQSSPSERNRIRVIKQFGANKS